MKYKWHFVVYSCDRIRISNQGPHNSTNFFFPFCITNLGSSCEKRSKPLNPQCYAFRTQPTISTRLCGVLRIRSATFGCYAWTRSRKCFRIEKRPTSMLLQNGIRGKSNYWVAPAGNRTRSPRMASGDFTIKPLVLCENIAHFINTKLNHYSTSSQGRTDLRTRFLT